MSILAVSLGLIRALPFELAARVAQGLLLTYLIVTPGVRREILANFLGLFPETASNGSRHVAQGFWLKQAWTLGRNLALMAQMGRKRLNKLLDNAFLSGENILERIMLQKGRVVVLSLHYGLWELLPQVFARRGYRTCSGFGRSRDGALGGRVSQMRHSYGVTMTNSVAEMRRAMRGGELVGFVLDNTSQTRRLDCDELLPGFRVLRTPFTLARAEQARLVPMFIYGDRNRLCVEIQNPVGSEHEFGRRARELIRSRAEDWVFWGKN